MGLTDRMIEQTMARLTGKAPMGAVKQPMRIIKKKRNPFGKTINHRWWTDRIALTNSMSARVDVMEEFLYIVIGEIGHGLDSSDAWVQAIRFIQECDKTLKTMQKSTWFFDVMKPVGSLLQYVVVQDLLRYRYVETAKQICKALGWNYSQVAFPEDYVNLTKGVDYLPFVVNYTDSDGISQEPYTFSALFELKSCFSIGDRFKSGKSIYTITHWCGEKALFALLREGEKRAGWYRSEEDLKKWEKIGNNMGIAEEYHRNREER
jgi:hypothetical protein